MYREGELNDSPEDVCRFRYVGREFPRGRQSESESELEFL